ncbi:mutase-like protein [Seminavis robusta]|uniref:Mutase-like protein n=1 Tax=Seminavis robusta TaxID=568900 RepID=A0A9N8EKQ9_9STRA|nr:mutase-like protein [Seminavis robusta]|eukprot:Sro1430_g271980.1 mutase-like protein (473) ;mRNA; f:24275-25693
MSLLVVSPWLHELVFQPSMITCFAGAVMGTLLTLLITYYVLFMRCSCRYSPAMMYHRDRRRRLPDTIIVIRHGESEANVDKSLWKTVPDNLLGLTSKGRRQARTVGKRVEALLDAKQSQRVHLIISPFERTLQTAHHLRRYFEHRIVRTDIESRVREQEMGNIQGDEFAHYRQQQVQIGRFWYRFPTGESGADVLDRVKSWWFESVLTVNTRPHYETVDTLVVVTHGLTMRFILMQLFGWSPTTFHSVWNAGNCDMYVLQKDLDKPGHSPYILDPTQGDMPCSSIDVQVTLKRSNDNKNKPEQRTLKLNNYLSIPPPRMTRKSIIKHLLAEQYPNIISSHKEIDEIVFMPFMKAGKIRGRSSSGVTASDEASRTCGDRSKAAARSSDSSSGSDEDDSSSSGTNSQAANNGEATEDSFFKHRPDNNQDELSDDEEEDIDDEQLWSLHSNRRAKREASLRYPHCQMMPGMKSWY